MKAFKLSEQDLDSGCREIQVEGELDLAVAERFGSALDRALRENGRVLIDLSRCEFIDSTGIALVVAAHHDTDGSGSRVALHSPAGQVLRVLQVTGLAENGLVFETADEAIAAL